MLGLRNVLFVILSDIWKYGDIVYHLNDLLFQLDTWLHKYMSIDFYSLNILSNVFVP